MIFALKLINLICLLWISVAKAEVGLPPIPHSDCPTTDDVNHPVMLPYPQDCSKYYSCLKGYAHLQQCPSNLHWSSITYRCDYPDKAKCQVAVSSMLHITPIVPEAAMPNLTPYFTGEIMYQLHFKDCNKYYLCRARSCPPFYYWNSITQKCDFPHNTYCPYGPASTGGSIQIQNPPIGEEIFNLLYPNDCAKYYQCQTLFCSSNLHWNIRLQKCDLPQLAQCPYQPQTTIVVESSTASNIIPTAFTAPPTPEIANNIVPTAFTAPPTPAVATNIVPTAFTNQPTPEVGTVPPYVITEDTSTICPDCAQRCDGYLHHYLPHPSDCHKFIQCNGWSFIHTCPDNLFWNAKLNTCDRICVPY